MALSFLIFTQGLRYSHFLNLRMTPCWRGWQKRRKRLYLSSWAKIEQTKDTLFSSTLKVWKNKEPFVFSILAQGLRYSHCLIFCQPRQQGAILEFRRWLYLCPRVKIEKTKVPLLSQILKVEENKVSLFFSIFAQELRFSLFLLFCQPHQQGAILKFRKWLYLSPWAKIEKKKMALYFSSTLKVWINKVTLVLSILAQGLRYSHFLNF